jgi:cysteine-rich repeat protein
MVSVMGKLALCALLVACSSNGGGSGDDDDGSNTPARCGDGHVDPGEQCDDGNTIANDGCTLCMIDGQRMAAIDATWELTNVAGATAACPDGYDTAAVIATPIAGGSAVTSTFACSAAMGTTSQLPAAMYNVQIAITNQAMSQTFGTSPAELVDLSDATDKPVDAMFLTDGGSFKLAWKLTKMSDGSTVACSDVSSMPHVKVLVTPDGGMGSSSLLSCANGMATTGAFVAGAYTVTVSILNDSFQNVGSAAPLTAQMIVAPNGLTDLGTVTIPVSTL